jgi:hypothetical protein
MQTFLPYVGNFTMSARALDNKRLNKQLLEGRQIYAALLGNTIGWRNHPATLMWTNHENMLFEYLKAIKIECERRGIKTDKNWSEIERMHESNYNRGSGLTIPAWMRDPVIANKIETTHRANLFIKDPIYYEDFQYATRTYRNMVCCDRCNYYWFTHKLPKEELSFV